MGTKLPKMGMVREHPETADRPPTRSIADALFSRTQQRVFALLFGQPERAFAVSEMIALAGGGSGAVQRELQRLLDSKLLIATVSGRQKRYQANRAAPIFEELRAIIEKTGVPGRLRAALGPLRARIELALLHGPFANQADAGTGDIDVLVVTDDVMLHELQAALRDAELDLHRRVNPTLHTCEEFRHHRCRSSHALFTRVLQGPFVVLVGDGATVATGR